MVAWCLLYQRNVSLKTRCWVVLNLLCFSYFALMTISTTILCWTVILPKIYAHETEKLWKHRFFIAFTFVNAVGNCVLCICSNTQVNKGNVSQNTETSDSNSPTETKGETLVTSETKDTNDEAKPKGCISCNTKDTGTVTNRRKEGKNGNEFQPKEKEYPNKVVAQKRHLPVNTKPYECDRCDRMAPARSHHCPLCRTCILKRDHHCFFMTVCIGYYNQKYFIMHCFYMMIGTLYGMFLIAIHLKTWYNVIFYGPQTFLTLFLDTVIKLAFNFYPSINYIVLVFMLYGCLGAGLSAAGLWFWQVQITLAGQTTREALRGIYEYARGKKYNFKDVFGKFWILTLFLPLPLPQLSDGSYADDVKKKS